MRVWRFARSVEPVVSERVDYWDGNSGASVRVRSRTRFGAEERTSGRVSKHFRFEDKLDEVFTELFPERSAEEVVLSVPGSAL